MIYLVYNKITRGVISMLKSGLKSMPVITIHIHPRDKEALKKEADKQSLQLATYCRMILLKSLNKEQPLLG